MDWPEQGVPKSGEGFIDFIGQVHKTKEQFGQEGPITIHCSAGVGRTGVFITLSIVLERMQYEGVLDVFQTVRILRSQRIHMVQTEVRLKDEKLIDILQVWMVSPDMYFCNIPMCFVPDFSVAMAPSKHARKIIEIFI